MLVKLRKRYYCEFCKKAGGSKFHMSRHENGCTLNPNRVCGMCKQKCGTQLPIEELISALRTDISKHDEDTKNKSLDEQLAAVEANQLRTAADFCPACILSAIRQTNERSIRFDYREEVASFWESVNIEREAH